MCVCDGVCVCVMVCVCVCVRGGGGGGGGCVQVFSYMCAVGLVAVCIIGVSIRTTPP